MGEQRAIGGNPEARQDLERIVRSGKTEQRIPLRARIILGAAEGKSNNLLATELKTSRPTVLDWRRRFAEGGVKLLTTTVRAGGVSSRWRAPRRPRLLPGHTALHQVQPR